MTDPVARFYFDFIDPLSYLLEREVRAVEASAAIRVERVGIELRPPPEPQVPPGDPIWSERWEAARRSAREAGVPLALPGLVPWSRKAHELHLFALEHECEGVARAATFDAYFGAARDIGRIDQLVEIAVSVGLDRTEAKAVLDVDRLALDVVAARDRARRAGVVDVPAITVGSRVVEGYRNQSDLSTLLGVPPPGH